MDSKEIRELLTYDDPVHIYPETSILLKPGDVLYSHKMALSSFAVGHTAIIGEDFRIYHINRWGKKGHSDSMPIYLSRHKKGEKLTIRRYEDSDIAREAAKWARKQIDRVENYIYTRNVGEIRRNYCSKYVWQAYYFGSEERVDLTARGINATSKCFITPAGLYRKLSKIGDFYNQYNS